MKHHVVQKEKIQIWLEEGPYAAFTLPDDVASHRHNLRLPIALACSMSEHIRLIFPMKGSFSRLIDAVFNEVLEVSARSDGNLLKRFVANSKGILYVHDISIETQRQILEGATLILITDWRVKRIALFPDTSGSFLSEQFK